MRVDSNGKEIQLTVLGVRLAREVRALLNAREALTEIVVALCQVLRYSVDTEESYASLEVFLPAQHFFVESRRFLGQAADE